MAVDPQPEDVGRRVLYHSGHTKPESGVVTSWNDHYVFVRFGSDTTSKACARNQLVWEHAPSPDLYKDE